MTRAARWPRRAYFHPRENTATPGQSAFLALPPRDAAASFSPTTRQLAGDDVSFRPSFGRPGPDAAGAPMTPRRLLTPCSHFRPRHTACHQSTLHNARERGAVKSAMSLHMPCRRLGHDAQHEGAPTPCGHASFMVLACCFSSTRRAPYRA